MVQLIALVLCAFSSFLHAEESDYKFAGRHFLASYMGCDLNAIGDVERMVRAMDTAVKASGATVLDECHYIFPPHGLTIVYLLSESHASLHTYPEHGACFVDLFTCGDRCSAEKFDEALRSYLKPQEVSARLFLRNEGVEEATYSNCAFTDKEPLFLFGNCTR